MISNTPVVNQITELLVDWKSENQNSIEELIPQIETELRKIAHDYMRQKNSIHNLQTTALMNEAFSKLNNQHTVGWENRNNFYALSSQIMRRVLINHARNRASIIRGIDYQQVNSDNTEVISYHKSLELLELDFALSKLDEIDPVKSSIVELKYFGGLTIEETADVLNLTTVKVLAHWKLAKAWLAREVRRNN